MKRGDLTNSRLPAALDVARSIIPSSFAGTAGEPSTLLSAVFSFDSFAQLGLS